MPHKETAAEFMPESYPPFPETGEFPTIDLETISLQKIQNGDATEQTRMFEACKDWGFFYLELSGVAQGELIRGQADNVARIAEQIFKLPVEEKLKYSLTGKDLFGYKKVGQTQVDSKATPDTAEFFNISKVSLLNQGESDLTDTDFQNEMIVPKDQMTRSWPAPVLENKDLFADYSKAAHSIGLQILHVLAEKLGIDPEEILSRHKIEKLAGDHIRMTRGPPRKDAAMPEIQTPSHTDFGSITVLMNWLGGLQVWSSPNREVGNLKFDDSTTADSAGTWLWVKPKPGCAIINLGDAAVKFTNGVLCSGRHRVSPAPGEQGKWPRYSIVYFVRPNDDCRLKTLKGEGIPPAGDEDEEGINAKEWIAQQSARLNRKA